MVTFITFRVPDGDLEDFFSYFYITYVFHRSFQTYLPNLNYVTCLKNQPILIMDLEDF